MRHLHHLFSLLLLMVVFTTTSCTDDFSEHPANQGYLPHPVSLIQTLDSINRSLVPSSTVLRAPKESDLSKEDKVRIALADASGAISGGSKGFKHGGRIGSSLGHPVTGATIGTIVGAVVKGGIKSYRTYNKIKEAKINSTGVRRTNQSVDDYPKAVHACSMFFNNSDSLNVDRLPIIYRDSISKSSVVVDDSLTNRTDLTNGEMNVGLAHNLVLAYLDGKIIIDDASVIDSATNIYAQKLLESQEFRAECVQDETDEDRDELPAKVEQLFFEVYETYANNCDDVVFIINKYVEAIDASNELSPEEKTSLKYGFATALYSTNYWEKELK